MKVSSTKIGKEEFQESGPQARPLPVIEWNPLHDPGSSTKWARTAGLFRAASINVPGQHVGPGLDEIKSDPAGGGLLAALTCRLSRSAVK
jgi:hypothetical protein